MAERLASSTLAPGSFIGIMKHYWLSTSAFTVCMDVNDLGTITKAAPIMNRFVGAQFDETVRQLDVRFANDVEVVELRTLKDISVADILGES